MEYSMGKKREERGGPPTKSHEFKKKKWEKKTIGAKDKKLHFGKPGKGSKEKKRRHK